MKRKSPDSHRSRPAAVAEVVRRLLAMALTREIQDPRLQHLTISEVSMSADLRHATVYVVRPSISEAKSWDEIEAAFAHSRAHFRKLLAERGGLRYVPELNFVPDTTSEQAERIERLLRDVASSP